MHILALQQTKPSLPSVTSTFMLLLKRLSFFPTSSFTRDEQSVFAGSFHRASLTTASHSSLLIFIVTPERFSHFVFILPSSYQSSSLVMEDIIYS